MAMDTMLFAFFFAIFPVRKLKNDIRVQEIDLIICRGNRDLISGPTVPSDGLPGNESASPGNREKYADIKVIF